MPAPRRPDEPFRPNLYVVARFLDALARDHDAVSRAQLQAAAGVNYDVFRRYLDFLVAKGYATEGPGGVLLTPAGQRVRDDLRGWLSRFLAGTRLPSGNEEPARPSARDAPAPP